MSTSPNIPPRHIPIVLKKGIELKDRYVISEACGSGGFGTVWRATDKQESRDVAIKRLSQRSGNDLEALRTEADSVIKLKGHKNIVQVFEIFETGGEGFLVMEYVDGETLETTLKNHIRKATWIDQDEALDYVKQTIEGLIYAHSSGIYHRDIKPSNILVSKLGVVKLVDFGLAKNMSDSAIGPASGFAWSGTANYMSYEQARGEDLNHQTDIMSVGIVTYILLTGKHPFNHFSGICSVQELISDDTYLYPSPTTFDGKPLKESLVEMLRRMLSRSKNQRYQNLIEPLGIISLDDSKQCSKCVASNPKHNLFCGQCGHSLGESTDSRDIQDLGVGGTSTSEELTQQGFARSRLNDWRDAITFYRQAISQDSMYAPAYANLGFALNRVGEYWQALEISNRGLLVTHDRGILHRIYDVLGFAKLSLNDPTGAIEAFTSSLNFKTNPRVFTNRAEAHAEMSDFTAAYNDVDAALSMDPDYTPAVRLRHRLGRV